MFSTGNIINLSTNSSLFFIQEREFLFSLQIDSK